MMKAGVVLLVDILATLAVGVGVVSMWRGWWYTLDSVLASDTARGAWSSLVLGAAGCTIWIIVQSTPCLRPARPGSEHHQTSRRESCCCCGPDQLADKPPCQRQPLPEPHHTSAVPARTTVIAAVAASAVLRQVATRLLAVLGFAGVVAFWRGVWYLHDVYLAPDHAILSPWLSMLFGWLLLLALGATRSLLASPWVVELDASPHPPLWRIPTYMAARSAQAEDDLARKTAVANNTNGAVYIGERHLRGMQLQEDCGDPDDGDEVSLSGGDVKVTRASSLPSKTARLSAAESAAASGDRWPASLQVTLC